MSKIKSLTPEQEKDLESFYQEMLKIGRSIEPINHDKAESIISELYKAAGFEKPEFIWFPSIKAIVDFKKENGDKSGTNGHFAGQQWIGWKAFYVFCAKIGVKFKDEDQKLLDLWFEESKNLHWWFPYKKHVLLSERPIRLTVNERGQLHNEKVKAIEYSDGWGLYYLNGVNVPEKLVTTDAEDLSLDFFTKEKNADVKAEFVRKFGVERMLHLGKMVDTYKNYDEDEHPYWHESQYELWDMKVLFEGLDYQPYVKMLNQTTGIWHVEAVSPESRTLKAAIKERFGNREMKIVGIA